MDKSNHIKQTFAARLRGLREAAKLTQQELGDRLGYSRGSISYYEKCERVPDIVFLDAVSNYFDVSVNFLLGYSDNKVASNDDIGFRFGLSDKAIEILDELDLCCHQEFISAFVEHEDFPKLFRYMAMYDLGTDRKDLSLNTLLDEHEFRHYQLTKIITAILDDLQKKFIDGGPFIDSLQDVDQEVRFQYYKLMLERSKIDSARIIAELEAEKTEANRRHRERFDEWANSEEGQRIRNNQQAAQDYVKMVTSASKEE